MRGDRAGDDQQLRRGQLDPLGGPGRAGGEEHHGALPGGVDHLGRHVAVPHARRQERARVDPRGRRTLDRGVLVAVGHHQAGPAEQRREPSGLADGLAGVDRDRPTTGRHRGEVHDRERERVADVHEHRAGARHTDGVERGRPRGHGGVEVGVGEGTVGPRVLEVRAVTALGGASGDQGAQVGEFCCWLHDLSVLRDPMTGPRNARPPPAQCSRRSRAPRDCRTLRTRRSRRVCSRTGAAATARAAASRASRRTRAECRP